MMRYKCGDILSGYSKVIVVLRFISIYTDTIVTYKVLYNIPNSLLTSILTVSLSLLMTNNIQFPCLFR